MASRLLLAAGLSAQNPPPVIKVSTRLIEVGVVAHDRRGAPVVDLSQADFEVFDDGSS